MPHPVLKECFELAQAGAGFDDTVCLTFEQRSKSRLRTSLADFDLVWFLPRGLVVRDSDILLCGDGTRVRVLAASEAVSEIASTDPIKLARLAYHLGNRHVGLQIGSGWLRYQADAVLDEMVVALGATPVTTRAPFDPERGAYHSHEQDKHL